MATDLLEMYPRPGARVPLAGLYLAHDLRARTPGPYVCSNFIVSLDGRIALPDPHSGLQQVPPVIANPRDWRLYLEIATQADVLLTTARHLRALAANRHTDLLAVAAEPELRAWRLARGLPPGPAVAAVSETLDFPSAALDNLPASLLVVTSSAAPHARERALVSRGATVRRLPGAGLDGAALLAALGEAGHRVVYSIAGPRILHALCAARVLHRLYVTHALALLGGNDFVPLLRGPLLEPPVRARLVSGYLDAAATAAGVTQYFAVYELNYAA